MAKVDQLDETVKMFNTRCYIPVKSSDVHRLLKYSIDDDSDDTDTTFDTMEHLGMILYVIGSHQTLCATRLNTVANVKTSQRNMTSN